MPKINLTAPRALAIAARLSNASQGAGFTVSFLVDELCKLETGDSYERVRVFAYNFVKNSRDITKLKAQDEFSRYIVINSKAIPEKKEKSFPVRGAPWGEATKGSLTDEERSKILKLFPPSLSYTSKAATERVRLITKNRFNRFRLRDVTYSFLKLQEKKGNLIKYKDAKGKNQWERSKK